jgi:hypothetical protein
MNSLLRLLLAGLVVTTLGMPGCKSHEPEVVPVQIGLTDSPGDFLGYTVDVISLQLVKGDGTTVDILPQRMRVDLARVVDLTEFVSGASIPSGTYVRATLNLDYANADLRVDDGGGNPVAVPLTNIVDTQNRRAATMSMTVTFDSARQLILTPTVAALLDFDFNLAASNQVDMSAPASPVVTVSPMLVADVDPDSPKPHRTRGPLDTVNVKDGSFTLVLRPFNTVAGDHGRVTFATDAATAFEIDRTPFQGSAGLTALSQKPRLTTPVVALGTLASGTRRFLATEVLAGSSVAFGTDDVLAGNVLSRIGNTLTVKAAELVRNDGTLIFRNTVQVTVGTATKVLKQGTTGAFAAGDISVGQRVIVFGALDAQGNTMDAQAGFVRLLFTQLNGTATGVSGGTVGMLLDRIDGRPAALFNFAGTGTPGNDANSASYVVATSPFPPVGIANGTPLKVRGFVQPFGQATAADDFNATTLIDVTDAPATLVVGWPSLDPAPFTFIQGGMSVRLSNAGPVRDVFRGGVDTPLLTTDTPVVQTANQGSGLFAIGINGAVQLYTQFPAYQQALQADLATGGQVRAFVASGGPYVDATKTLTAGAMAAALQ